MMRASAAETAAKEEVLAEAREKAAAEEPVEVPLSIATLPVESAQTGNFLRDHLKPATVNDNEITVTIQPGELRSVLVG